ncbi:ubiquitin carboxyl-terminal hydrolase 8 [Galendromus occidentalis]|uniref:ubiquitinyl hydrolase 1 n=1 Tax=Galendromus occidentalis TaxID=34638 RepID=A0AAJ6VX70_9ACAR|nr:ubiquitin carboxyl-terminal hydrolase 8 [Galendromus occidentalis]
MSTTNKPLRYSNFRDLQKNVEKSNDVPLTARCKTYYTTATQLYDKAQRAKLDGDLEAAFIFFVRFGNLALRLKNAPDFSQAQYPGLRKAADAISEAEVLQSELMKLYEVKLCRASTASVSANNNISHNPQDQQRRATQVYDMLENHKCLVIDLREQAEFEDSHMVHKYLFNLPGKFLKPSQTGVELEEATRSLQSHPMFLQRNAFEYIVILDYDTQNPFHAGVPDNHPIRLLYSILTSDDSKAKKLKNLPVILKGGYRLWLASYPRMTTNAHPRKLNESIPPSHFPSVNVNYPSLDVLSTPIPSAPPAPDTAPSDRILQIPERPSSSNRPVKPYSGESIGPTSNENALPRSRSLTEIASVNEQSLVKPEVDRASKPSTLPGSARNKHDMASYRVSKTHGLRNLGCSCYINASLQCLSHTRNLAAYFLQGQYKNDIATDDSDLTQEQLLLPELFENVLYYLYYGGDEESLTNFWREVFNAFPQFKRNSHECAHEFITNLLSTLHDVLNRASHKSRRSEIPEIDENNVEIALNKFFTERHDESRSIIGDIFEGLTVIQRQCRTCKNSSYKFDVTFSLGLPIPDRPELTLDDCLQEAFQTQVVDYKCTHCNSQQKATQSERIARLPKVLVITFLRFRHFQDSTRQKANNHIEFENVISLDKYLDFKTQPKSKSYHLYAVVNHYGELDRGHYVAFCKSLSSNLWHKYDDQIVTENPMLADSDKRNTYIAFYMCDES